MVNFWSFGEKKILRRVCPGSFGEKKSPESVVGGKKIRGVGDEFKSRSDIYLFRHFSLFWLRFLRPTPTFLLRLKADGYNSLYAIV